MIDLLAKKSRWGDVSINKARQHLARHEWGLARLAIEEGLIKGGLEDRHEVERLLEDIRQRLWNSPA
jgi:hypothetical protein